MKYRRLISAVLSLFAVLVANAAEPSGSGAFGYCKPVYFNSSLDDVKFQVSFSCKVFGNMFGHEGLDLSIGYSQRSVWEIYDHSSPFKDNMYNPGLYLNIPTKGEGGSLTVGAEHRSNGRDDPWSRSINYLFAEYVKALPCGVSLLGNVRAGYGWIEDDPTLDVFTCFYGYCSVGAMYELGRLSALVRLSPVFDGFNVNANAELAWRLGKDIASPFHVFLQYNHGYDEAMCDWVRGFDTGHTLRFGFMISPSGAVRLRQ